MIFCAFNTHRDGVFPSLNKLLVS